MNRNGVSVLLVDDEESMLEWLSLLLEQNGYTVNSFSQPELALKWSSGEVVHVLVSDIKMPGMNGLTLFEKLRILHPDLAGIFMTAFSSVDTAVEAVRQGASDYLIKPFKTAQMLAAIEKAVRVKKIITENRILKQKISTDFDFKMIIGRSRQITEVLETVRKIADHPNTVLVTGESGTGKELIAKAIHNNSLRRKEPFIGVNCGSISPNLLESELFGHRRGSFTGAFSDREGLMLAAGEGTLFLDEIGELSRDLQVKLLRAIQEKQIRPVGDTRVSPFRARLICATNRDLAEMVKAGSFRSDLFYRLNVLPLHLPPLRERREDIPALVTHFIKKGIHPEKQLSADALKILTEYSWPGNVRELQNIVERICIMSGSPRIEVSDLPEFLIETESVAGDASALGREPAGDKPVPTLEEIEKAWIYYVLEKKAGGEKRRASKILGINEATLHRRLRKYREKTEG